jgi:hypothetical protein
MFDGKQMNQKGMRWRAGIIRLLLADNQSCANTNIT